MKGLLLWLINNYCLIFLWKAQMAAKFQYGKSLLKSKKRLILFRKKNIKILHRVFKHVCHETAFWIENFPQIQNGGHYRAKSYNKLKHFKMMMLFNCCVRMHVYSTEGFCFLKNIVYLQ